MAGNTSIRRTLLCEAAGFVAVVAMLWVNEWLDLPHRLFGAAATPVNWVESCMETMCVAALAAVVLLASRLLLARIRYLEGFLPVCRSCRKIRIGDEWMSIAAYLKDYGDQAVSCGLCPDCDRRRRAAARELPADAGDDPAGGR